MKTWQVTCTLSESVIVEADTKEEAERLGNEILSEEILSQDFTFNTAEAVIYE